jgi:HSP20 family molecular chaperone IbpA
MMVEIELKSDVHKPGWLAANETEPNSSHFSWRVSGHPLAWRPPTDVYVTDKAIVIRVEIAGMKDGEFVISLENNILTIRGTRPDNSERRAYHQMEIRFGEFRTDIELHWPVDSDYIDAEYHDGFLHLLLPKTKPYNVEIQD